MFRRYLSLLLVVFIPPASLSAALSQSQVNDSLGKQPGLNWSVTGDRWTVTQWEGLNYNSFGPDDAGTLQTSVTGPALLTLGSYCVDDFDVFIFVDGVQSGTKLRTSGLVQSRVVVPAGAHTVRWKASRRVQNNSADRRTLTLGPPTLETYSVVPLQTAVAEPGIVVGGNWIGQNRWHAGDGAAAWSGDRDEILRAEVQGPGMFSFKALENVASGCFRINGGAWEQLPRPRDPGYWIAVNRYVTPGSHVFEWKCLNTDHQERIDGELLIDEIKLLPEVGISAALDTPQWSWNVVYPQPGPGFPMGTPYAGAEGGAALIAAGSAAISTNVTLPKGIILTRTKEVFFQATSNSTYAGKNLFFTTVTEGPHYVPGWITCMAEIQAGSGPLVIQVGAGLTLDSVKFIPAPETPAATLGMQEGSFTIGGGGSWQISPLPMEGRYALMPLKSAGVSDSWIDVPVAGPAEFRVRFRDASARPALSIQVDGHTLWTPYYSGVAADQAKVELPAGNHVVRLSCDLRSGFLESGIQFYDFSVGPLGTGEKTGPLEKAGPWLSTGAWKAAARNHDGQDALSPVDPVDPVDRLLVGGRYVAQTFWDGPGYASAWFYQPSSIPAASARIGWQGDLGGATAVAQIPNGWRKETFWVPPGRHAAGIAAFGNAASINDLVVDSVAFAADTVIPLGQGLGGRSFQWTMDPQLPWTGIQRGSAKEAVAVSPLLAPGVVGRLSTTVHGPGTLSYRWRKGGNFPSTSYPALTVNGAPFSYLYNNDTSASYQIDANGPLVLEWSHKGTAGYTDWLELSDVLWTPLPGKPLAEVLDSGSGVSWTTSADPVFLGRDNAWAAQGSAAHTALPPGAEAWLEAVVSGPGIFDFKLLEIPLIAAGWLSGVSCEVWVDNVKTSFDYAAGQPLTVTGSGTHRIRLKFRNTTSETLFGAVDQALWMPLPGKPLADVLDAGSGVTWSTSESTPFTGQNNSLAANGSAAHTTLGAGGTAWLEGRVTGPGIFDFKLLENPAARAGWVSQVLCEVWVDGVRNSFAPNGQEPLWITGGGAHQIRLKFHNPTAGTLSGAVDQVTWRALSATTAADWTASHASALASFSNGGKDNAAVIVFNTTQGQEKWVERTVTGPGQLEWNICPGRGEAAYSMEPTLKMELDGTAAVPLNIYGWKRYRLAVPAGTHRIRWTSKPPEAPSGEATAIQNHLWWISKPTFSSGTPAFVNALDLPSVNWMLVGEDNPSIVIGGGAWDRTDAVSIPVSTQLLCWNTSAGPLGMQGMLTQPYFDTWEIRNALIPAGALFEWGMRDRTSVFSGAIKADKVELFPVSPIPIAEALDITGDLHADGWLGTLSSTSSADGSDVALSVLDKQSNTLNLPLPAGPSRIRFKWRKDGGILQLFLNGRLLRVSPAGPAWKEIVLDLGEGSNQLQVIHSTRGGLDPTPLLAWVDSFSVTGLPGWSLGSIVTQGSAPAFTNSIDWPSSSFWIPMAYTEEGGSAVSGARVISGASMMKARIEGPAMVSFRGRMHSQYAPIAGVPINTGQPSNVPKVEVGDGTVFLNYELAACIDGVRATAVAYRNDTAWSNASFTVPAGLHEITWQLASRYRRADGSEYNNPLGIEHEGWVDQIRIKGGREFYDEWVGARPFPPARKEPLADADGDGASNLMEYACGTDPLVASSKPAQANGGVTAEGGMYHYSVPYLSGNVVGTIETSSDLKTWDAYPASIAQAAPASGLGATAPAAAVPGICYFTPTHQVLPVAITSDRQKLYFRLRLRLPGEVPPQ